MDRKFLAMSLTLLVGILATQNASAIEPHPAYGPAMSTGITMPYPKPPPFKMFQSPCPYYQNATVACATGDEIYVPKGWGPFTFHHEEGHIFDQYILTDTHRIKILRLMRVPISGTVDDTWWGTVDPNDDLDNYDPPGEWFADAYGICTMQATGRMMIGMFNWGSRGYATAAHGDTYSYKVSARTHRRICQVIWHAGGMKYNLRPRLPENWRGLDVWTG